MPSILIGTQKIRDVSFSERPPLGTMTGTETTVLHRRNAQNMLVGQHQTALISVSYVNVILVWTSWVQTCTESRKISLIARENFLNGKRECNHDVRAGKTEETRNT